MPEFIPLLQHSLQNQWLQWVQDGFPHLCSMNQSLLCFPPSSLTHSLASHLCLVQQPGATGCLHGANWAVLGTALGWDPSAPHTALCKETDDARRVQAPRETAAAWTSRAGLSSLAGSGSGSICAQPLPAADWGENRHHLGAALTLEFQVTCKHSIQPHRALR